MRRRLSLLVVGLAIIGLLVGATGCTKLQARDQLNKGVSAFKTGRYPEAVEFFKESIALDPELITARLYLATAYMSQYVPGSSMDDNLEMARLADEEFHRVLDVEPDNAVAIASIASLHFHQKNYDEAEEWNHRLLEVDPENKEALYTLGVIAWQRTFQRRMEARVQLGMRTDDPGPLKDEEVRTQLTEQNLPIIEQGLEDLNTALEIDPEYDDAMAYLNLLYRERADLAATEEEYEEDILTADTWIDKTLETRKIKAAREQQAAFGLEGE